MVPVISGSSSVSDQFKYTLLIRGYKNRLRRHDWQLTLTQAWTRMTRFHLRLRHLCRWYRLTWEPWSVQTAECRSSPGCRTAETPPAGCEARWRTQEKLSDRNCQSHRRPPEETVSTSETKRQEATVRGERVSTETIKKQSSHKTTNNPSWFHIIQTFILRLRSIFLVWFMSHLLTWRRKG